MRKAGFSGYNSEYSTIPPHQSEQSFMGGSEVTYASDVSGSAPFQNDYLPEDFQLLTENTEAPPPPAFHGVEMTVGTEGHPHSCSLPCKYNGTARGCKDGTNCTNCHICKWCPWMKTKRGKQVLLSSKGMYEL